MHQSWSGVEAEEAEWRQKRQSGGRRGGWGWRQLEVGREGEGRLYHDIMLCPTKSAEVILGSLHPWVRALCP